MTKQQIEQVKLDAKRFVELYRAMGSVGTKPNESERKELHRFIYGDS